MTTLITIFHVIFCVFLILVFLLQTGKGAGMGSAFGGSSSTVFGPRGAGSFIGKLTGVVAALFMVSSLTLAYMSSSNSTSLADRAALEKETGVGQEVELDDVIKETSKEPAPAAEEAIRGDAGPSSGSATVTDASVETARPAAAEEPETP